MSAVTPPLTSQVRHHPPVPGEHAYYDCKSERVPYLTHQSRAINFSVTERLEVVPPFVTYHGIVPEKSELRTIAHFQ